MTDPASSKVSPIRPGENARPVASPPSVRTTAPPAGNLKTPPAWLSAPAKLLWRSIVPSLDETYPELISSLDIPALGLMVENLAIAQAAAAAMRTKGNRPTALAVPDNAHGGMMKKAPASQVMRDHGKAFLELARDYGLTLRGRASINLERLVGVTVPDGDDDDDLFAD